MSLVHLSNVCSHLQNVSAARLPVTSIPSTKLHLQVALGLYRQGFISSVSRGSTTGPDETYVATTPENVATRRLWLGLKYHNMQPVLKKMELISKPSRRVWFNCSDLEKLVSGRDANFVKQLLPGEVMFLRTDKGLFEIREAVEKRIGGELLCRARS
ncbi:mitochondrial 37S ribosomal protein uS8m [Dipodascopsis tothii]|uniref:mitochondrial 37S ribosomal protein uS8m n=1 Tax=Dipodascopsis tothii TaxID=44089 RepID=UPI0034CE06C1